MSYNNSLPFVNNTNVTKQKRPGRGRRKHVDNSNSYFGIKKSKIDTCIKQVCQIKFIFQKININVMVTILL